jgi:hypothetical protein
MARNKARNNPSALQRKLARLGLTPAEIAQTVARQTRSNPVPVLRANAGAGERGELYGKSATVIANRRKKLLAMGVLEKEVDRVMKRLTAKPKPAGDLYGATDAVIEAARVELKKSGVDDPTIKKVLRRRAAPPGGYPPVARKKKAATPAATPAVRANPKAKAKHPALRFGCPSCGARRNASCLSGTGNDTAPHSKRRAKAEARANAAPAAPKNSRRASSSKGVASRAATTGALANATKAELAAWKKMARENLGLTDAECNRSLSRLQRPTVH